MSSPSKAVDDEMVERACIAYHPEHWARAAESSREIMRLWMRDALIAALSTIGESQ